MPQEDFITTDLKLPNHENELSKAQEVLDKHKKRFEIIKTLKTIDGKNHMELYEQIVRVLDYVGRLSMPAFDLEYPLEEMYIQQYKGAPAMAKTLWLEHYEHIHHPYTLIKNRCFRLLEELDAEFINVHKKNPPNWNI